MEQVCNDWYLFPYILALEIRIFFHLPSYPSWNNHPWVQPRSAWVQSCSWYGIGFQGYPNSWTNPPVHPHEIHVEHVQQILGKSPFNNNKSSLANQYIYIYFYVCTHIYIYIYIYMYTYTCVCFHGFQVFSLNRPSFFGCAEGNPEQHPERVSVELQHGDLITMEELGGSSWGCLIGYFPEIWLLKYPLVIEHVHWKCPSGHLR